MPGSIAELAGRSPSDEGWVGGGGRSRRRHWWRRALLVDARRRAPIVIPGFLPAAATERRQHCKYESMSRARRLTPRDAIILSSRIQYNDRALERDVHADVTTKMLAVCQSARTAPTTHPHNVPGAAAKCTCSAHRLVPARWRAVGGAPRVPQHLASPRRARSAESRRTV